MNNVLVLSFIVEDGSKFNITVTDPREGALRSIVKSYGTVCTEF